MAFTKQRSSQGVVTLAIKFDNVLMFHGCSLLPCHVSVSYIHLNPTVWIVANMEWINREHPAHVTCGSQNMFA
jgi:hypothetical protein